MSEKLNKILALAFHPDTPPSEAMAAFEKARLLYGREMASNPTSTICLNGSGEKIAGTSNSNKNAGDSKSKYWDTGEQYRGSTPNQIFNVNATITVPDELKYVISDILRYCGDNGIEINISYGSTMKNCSVVTFSARGHMGVLSNVYSMLIDLRTASEKITGKNQTKEEKNIDYILVLKTIVVVMALFAFYMYT